MTNTELTKIREDKGLSKSEFAAQLGVTPMLLGRYEKGSREIPVEIEEKIKEMGTVEKELAKKSRKKKIEDAAVATEIEVKKTVRKGGRKVKEKIEEAVEAVKTKEDKVAAGKINIIIQSPMGGVITPAEIVAKVPKDAEDVYVRVDENKLYYVLKNDESGSVEIW